jgi:hypothetical protein
MNKRAYIYLRLGGKTTDAESFVVEVQHGFSACLGSAYRSEGYSKTRK